MYCLARDVLREELLLMVKARHYNKNTRLINGKMLLGRGRCGR